jgi:hypothetical protein
VDWGYKRSDRRPIALFVGGDGLPKGAGVNALQIAEGLLELQDLYVQNVG